VDIQDISVVYIDPPHFQLSVQLVSKISNLRGPDPPTSQTDRQTDDMQSQYSAIHYTV